jgi:hypothetical protein
MQVRDGGCKLEATQKRERERDCWYMHLTLM